MSLPAGQHEWEATFGHDHLGRPVPPTYQALVFVSLARDPGPEGARALESSLCEVEGRYVYGSDGLLTTVGWGARWFREYTEHPALISLPGRMSRWEDPILDEPHAVFHLASNHESILAEVIDELFAESADLGEWLSVDEIRRGFVGAGLPSEAFPELGIEEQAPLLLGFHSIHRGSQATEADITVTEGPLVGGTTAHVSRIVLDVDRWHAQSQDRQAALMYAPTVSASQARALVDDAPSDYESYEQTVREHGIVGHAQAAARARVNNVPVINRRDFATLDNGKPGTHFVSLQREFRDFNNTRAIMNGADGPSYHQRVGARRHNGINSFFDVTHRTTLGIPARANRSFPLVARSAVSSR